MNKTINIRGKRLPLWSLVVVAIAIVTIVAAAIIWSAQNRQERRGYIFTGTGNNEIVNDHIRLWTGPTANTWSGVKTEQTWLFSDNLRLTTQINVTSLTATFYGEVILVDEDADTGFGFQLTYAAENKVRIRGMSWGEEGESPVVTNYTDKEVNQTVNLELKKISADQIDFYIDDTFLGSISTSVPSSGFGLLNVDLTNGNQGGNAEVTFSFEVGGV